MPNSERLKKDPDGQWWFYFDDVRRVRASIVVCKMCGEGFPTYRRAVFCSVACRARSRATTPELRLCAGCEGNFLPGEKSQRFCSHACAARTYHAKQRVTTRGIGEIKGADNPRFELDARGQWWYVAQYRDGRKSRTRARVAECEECKQRFLTSIFHRAARFCSRKCASKREVKNPVCGERHHAWKGGRMVTPKGYVAVLTPYHPSLKGSQRRYVLEHRLVMEQITGRFLKPKEHVHHRNGIRNDNRPENLELWVNGHPPGQRVEEQRTKHCPTCTCYLNGVA